MRSRSSLPRSEQPAPAAAPKRDKGSAKKGDKAQELKVPYPDPVTEQVVLAAALVDLEVRRKLCGVLTPDFFFAEGHASAWEVVAELERRGLAYDPATVRQLSGGKVDAAYLDQLIEQRPAVPPNLQHHLDVLRWDRTRVEAIRGPVSGLVEALADATSSPEKVLSLARAATSALEGHSSLRYLRDSKQLIREQVEAIRARRNGAACYPLGIPGLDVYADTELAGQWRLVPGLAPKTTTVVTGLPGSGKTTFTARVAVEQANQQRRVLYGAWEQGSGLTLELCALVSLGLSRTALLTGQVSDEHVDAMEREMERLSEWIRFFEVPFDRSKGEKHKRWEVNDAHLDTIFEYLVATGPDVAIFDLWRRAIGDLDPDAEERALYRQQAMFQETQVAGVLIHQLRLKDVEQRADKRPTREAIKGSGAWVEVPDTILGVHREFLFKAVPDDTLGVHVLKQRHGVWPLAVDHPWSGETGYIGEGRTAEAPRPGAKGSIDSFLDGGDVNPAVAAQRKERSNGKRRRA